MNRTIKTLLLAGALAATGGALAATGGALAATGGAMAFGGGHHGMGGKECDHGGPGLAPITQLEGITDEQRDQLEQLRDEQREAGRTLRDEMRQNRQALRKATREGAADTVASLARKQGDLVEQMVLRRFEMQQKVNAILTEEQRQELEKLRLERRSGRWRE